MSGFKGLKTNVTPDKTADHQTLPEEHKDCGWHQKDLIASDKLQDVLLICCELVQKVPHKHKAVWAHGLRTDETDTKLRMEL